MRPRPGRMNSAEYGSWLILICCTADADSVRALTSTPSTSSVVPPVPIALESRNRDIAPTMSWSRTGRSSSASSSMVIALRFDAALALAWAPPPLTDTSCVTPSICMTTVIGAGAQMGEVGLESGKVGLNVVRAGRDALETERPAGVGDGRLLRLVRAPDRQQDLRARNHGAGLIL